MWKDYFYLTKRERNSVWVLTILVLILQIGIWTSDLWLKPIARLVKSESKQQSPTVADTSQPVPGESYSNTSDEGSASPTILRTFNPNTADSVQLSALGIKPKVVRNILKYRSKGGQFRKTDDLAKIYGLDAELFNRLRPYIRMTETPGSTYDSFGERTAGMNDREVESGAPVFSAMPVSTYSENLTLPVETPSSIQKAPPSSSSNQFELNEADTATLQLLKGVGAVTADRIVRYRQQLGGFYDVHQLNEIKGLYPTVLETLTKTVSVNPEKITKININKASLEKLKAHPYLDFYQAKVIVELRKNRKTIRTLSELSAFTEFTPTDLERLKWYLEP
jgi:DNA uptake protein ComE-like DNA-binding protein